MTEVVNDPPKRYERNVLPGFYDAVMNGFKFYHFKFTKDTSDGSNGVRLDIDGDYLRNIKKKDILVFKVSPEKVPLGKKGEHYKLPLEVEVEGTERKGENVYIRFK